MGFRKQPSGATTLHKKEHGSKNEFVLLNVSPDGYPGERIEWIQNHTKTAQMHTKKLSKWSQNVSKWEPRMYKDPAKTDKWLQK